MGYSNFDVAHAWAHNLDKCTSGSSLYHCNGKLRSYSTCIGQRIEIGDKIVFILNNYSFSNSTSKHQSLMSQAVPRLDSNVHVFNVDVCNYGNSEILYTTWDGQISNQVMIKFGLKFLVKEFENCLDVPKVKTKDLGFTYSGFNDMQRWFIVTECTTVKKLLKMKSDDFIKLLPHKNTSGYYSSGSECLVDCKKFKKFLRLMSEGAEITDVVDTINGKGTYSAYLERTDYLRAGEKNKRLSIRLGYAKNGIQRHKIFGKYTPVRYGSITQSIRKKYSGDKWMQYLLKEKHRNEQVAMEHHWASEKNQRIAKSINKLKRHCGLAGWKNRVWQDTYRQFSSFNYNGTVFDFTDKYWLNECELCVQEYLEYTKLTKEEQKKWVIQKRQWMLEELQRQQEEHDTLHARMEEQARIMEISRQRKAALEQEKREYKNELLKQGQDGLKRLWREGFNVNVNHESREFFSGGNVLLRVVDKAVETSKGIVILYEECKRLWAIIQRWHNNNAEFYSGERARSTYSSWNISRYQNGIMVAGCHAIAYSEMAYVAKKLGLAS